jgi:hypothetical protein
MHLPLGGLLVMRFASHCCAAILTGLILSSSVRAEEWRTVSVPGQNDVIASYKHVDGAAMLVICDTGNRHLSIAYQEPQAKWQQGRGVDVITLPDSGQQPSPSYGLTTAPNQIVIKHDVVFDVWTMRQAKDSFKMSVGDYARFFPTANFRSAVEPVLKACGAQW